VLGVPVNFFFEGAPSESGLSNGFAEPSAPVYMADFAGTPEGHQLITAFLRIKEPKLRKKIIDLVVAMSVTGEE
jgi:hypothetical protein